MFRQRRSDGTLGKNQPNLPLARNRDAPAKHRQEVSSTSADTEVEILSTRIKKLINMPYRIYKEKETRDELLAIVKKLARRLYVVSVAPTTIIPKIDL
jgi:hypothetical protein